MKIERLLAITIMLLVQRKVTARQLADHFEVSVRTIYRDLDSLNHAGIPVTSYQGHEGGFCIPDNFKLSRQLLTYEDMVSILTSLKGINSTLENREISTIINKITALIPEEKQEHYQLQSNSFIIDITPWDRSSNLDQTLQLVHQGISNSSLLHFSYINNQGIESERRVEPHTLLLKNFTWYLLAFCHLRHEFRIFRLSRLKNPALLSEKFDRRPVQPSEHFHLHHDSKSAIDVELLFSQNVRQHVEEHFSKDHLSFNTDGTLTARFSAPQPGWVIPFILSFGEDVEVLTPPALRNEVAEKIARMKNLYSNLT